MDSDCFGLFHFQHDGIVTINNLACLNRELNSQIKTVNGKRTFGPPQRLLAPRRLNPQTLTSRDVNPQCSTVNSIQKVGFENLITGYNRPSADTFLAGIKQHVQDFVWYILCLYIL